MPCMTPATSEWTGLMDATTDGGSAYAFVPISASEPANKEIR